MVRPSPNNIGSISTLYCSWVGSSSQLFLSLSKSCNLLSRSIWPLTRKVISFLFIRFPCREFCFFFFFFFFSTVYSFSCDYLSGFFCFCPSSVLFLCVFVFLFVLCLVNPSEKKPCSCCVLQCTLLILRIDLTKACGMSLKLVVDIGRNVRWNRHQRLVGAHAAKGSRVMSRVLLCALAWIKGLTFGMWRSRKRN